MNMDKTLYGEVKKEFGKRASWALWDKTDYRNLGLIESGITRLKPRYFFVGLNPSVGKNRITEPWRHFHCTRQGSMEGVMAEVLMDTKYEGAYITDILKNCDEGTTAGAKEYKKTKPGMVEKDITLFLREYELLKPEKVFVFGFAAQEIFRKYERLKDIPFVHVRHPSPRFIKKADRIAEIRKDIGLA
jgi:uracil-DNA glycosylase